MKAKALLRLFGITLGVMVAVWLFSAGDATNHHVFTGSVVEWQQGRSISVANRPNDTVGIQFTLRNTVYDENPRKIHPGARVAVEYEIVGESRFVASRIRVVGSGLP